MFGPKLSQMNAFHNHNPLLEDYFNPLMPELNPSTQRCLTRFLTGDFAS
jgi:hypothetical protein